MILADTSVWVDHLRKRDATLSRLLEQNSISIHPFVVAELSMGSLPDRKRVLASLDLLPAVKVAQLNEVRQMIERHALSQQGIGFVDAHLIVSTLITSHTVLWSRDKRLLTLATKLGIGARLR